MEPLVKSSSKAAAKVISKRCVAISDTLMNHDALTGISGDWLFHTGNFTNKTYDKGELA